MGEQFHELMDGVSEFSERNREESDVLRETYEGSDILSFVEKQKAQGNEASALFTDIDNTFIREGREDATRELTEKAREGNYPVIAITGNDFNGVARRIEKGELPYFEAIAGSVGTEIWIKHTDEKGGVSYKKDEFFESILKQTGYDRTEIAKNGLEMISDCEKNHPEWKLNFQRPDREKELSLHPDPSHQTYKVSFHFFSDPSSIENVGGEIEKFFPNQSIVICEEIGYNKKLMLNEGPKKYCLDILPTTKAGAVEYLGKIAGIKKGMVAGDSGNDARMLLESESFIPVLVGGHTQEAKNEVRKSIKTKKGGARSFQSIEKPGKKTRAIYIEKNPQRQAAQSILRAAEILRRAENIKKIRENKKPQL